MIRTPDNAFSLLSLEMGSVRWRLERPGDNLLGVNLEHFYLVGENGLVDSYSLDTISTLRCFDFQTGKQVWTRRIPSGGLRAGFFLQEQNKILEKGSDLWLASGPLEWLSVRDGRLVKEAPMAVAAIFPGSSSNVFVVSLDEAAPAFWDRSAQSYVVHEIKGRKATRLDFKIPRPFFDPDRPLRGTGGERVYTATVVPFGRNGVIFSESRTCCFNLEDGSLMWERVGQYKAQLGSCAFVVREGQSTYTVAKYDQETGKEQALATYSFDEMFTLGR
jgi:outer membrane protein assembly factor BamB